MSKLPQISDAEWEIMQVIWRQSSITAAETVAELGERTGWNHRTIRTLLGRLVRKKAIGFKTLGNRYVYHPLVSRESCVRAESQSFIQKIFCGDTASLLVHFVRHGDLSAEDLLELKKTLMDKAEETAP
jgi:BlaI family penicillinase repressor